MKYRTDVRSGNNLSILGFGCMRLPRNVAVSEQLIMRAINQGVNYFDTAYIYSGNEELVGGILAKNGVREKIYLATKLPIMLCRSPQDFDKYFNKELERLKTNYIDYYMMHMITDFAQWEMLRGMGIEKWIAGKVASGAVKQVGFSFHGMRDDFLRVLDSYDWDFCQIQYNYSDENYQAGVTGLKRAAEKGIPVIIMEPLLGGKLANNLPAKAVEVLREADPSLSPAAWALRWLWNQPEVTVILSGMNEMPQLEDNLKTADSSEPGMLTDMEMATLKTATAIFRESNKIPCTGCGYCMPCPRGVNIPACFATYNTSYSMNHGMGIRQYMQSTGGISRQQSGASLCVQCKKCESHCPQNIGISSAMPEVSKRMEPFWYKVTMKIARAYLGRGIKKTKA